MIFKLQYPKKSSLEKPLAGNQRGSDYRPRLNEICSARQAAIYPFSQTWHFTVGPIGTTCGALVELIDY